MEFDIVIVGGGTAGCVLANRLSESGRRRVLLIEAGPDMPHGKIPETLLDSYPGAAYTDKSYTWKQLRVATAVHRSNLPETPESVKWKSYEQARVLGGGSTINGQLAHRGAPDDYDEWERRGARGWNWDDVLPFFRKLERDMDFDGPLHGKDGPIPIRRIFPDLWPGHAKAVAAALEASGFRYLPDQNGDCVEGYYPIAMSNAYERRVSTATAYLDPVTRQRKNLTILCDTSVSRLLLDGKKCVGIEIVAHGQKKAINAVQVILSSGAIHSPAILLRSGIGPAAELAELGISVAVNRPGVGRKLMDHPSVALASYIRPEARVNHFTRRHMLLGWRYSSGIGDAPFDMAVVAASRSAWHAIGAQLGSLLLIVNKTFSESGAVTLRSAEWRDEPDVQFRLLADSRDTDRLVDGVLRLIALQSRPEFRAVASDTFPAVWGEKVRQIGEINVRNRILTGIGARLIDGPNFLRRLLLRNLVADKFTLSELKDDAKLLRQFIEEAVIGVWHPSCSCRMGAANDINAVTDPEGRVYGIEGLRVVDASVFPVIPRAALNLTVAMVAEKIAAAITAGR